MPTLEDLGFGTRMAVYLGLREDPRLDEDFFLQEDYKPRPPLEHFGRNLSDALEDPLARPQPGFWGRVGIYLGLREE